MSASALISGFLSYLLLMAITVGVAFVCGFIGLKLRKRSDAKKKAEDEAKKLQK